MNGKSSGMLSTLVGTFTFILTVWVATTAQAQRTATAVADVVEGRVERIIILDFGERYNEPPLVKITGGGGAGARATAVIGADSARGKGPVKEVFVEFGGSGYTTIPQVEIESPQQALTRVQFGPQASTEAQAEVEGESKTRSTEKVEMFIKAGTGISFLGFIGFLLFSCRKSLPKFFSKRACKLCGAKYSMWKAPVGTGMCSLTCWEKEKLARQKERWAREGRAEEAARQRRTSSGSLSSAQPNQNTPFYCSLKGEEKGPYTFTQLTSMWENGQITADALYRTSDTSEWLPLLPRLAKPTPPSQPTSEDTPLWVWRVAIFGSIILVVLACGGAALFNDAGKNNGSAVSRSSSSSSRSHKSARQLIRERAQALHGRNDHIEIDSGFAGGAYQVTVWENFHVYTYAVVVDDGEITAWELRDAH